MLFSIGRMCGGVQYELGALDLEYVCCCSRGQHGALPSAFTDGGGARGPQDWMAASSYPENARRGRCSSSILHLGVDGRYEGDNRAYVIATLSKASR